MNPLDPLTELPNTRNHNCFGCSPMNPSGLRMRFFTDGRAVYSSVRVPEHLCGWSRIAHGGAITTILDEIMSWAAIHLLRRIALTQTMSIEFVKAVPVASLLHAEGRVLETNHRNDAVTAGTLTDAGGDICARATAKFKVFSPAVARRLRIADEDSIQFFERIFSAEPARGEAGGLAAPGEEPPGRGR
jgi:acyl-coenzyme A thioesterase PaaI-like protein